MIAGLRIALLRIAVWLGEDSDEMWRDGPLAVVVAENQRRIQTGTRPIGGYW